jgi:toluene monooxygenase system protein A
VPDRWCFEQDPERYANTRTLVDRFLGGEVQPPTLEGILNYMSLGPGEIGDDAEGYAWLDAYRNHPKYKKAS